MRELQSQLLNELAVQVLRFDPSSPFCSSAISAFKMEHRSHEINAAEYFPDGGANRNRQRWSYMWNWIYSAKWSAG